MKKCSSCLGLIHISQNKTVRASPQQFPFWIYRPPQPRNPKQWSTSFTERPHRLYYPAGGPQDGPVTEAQGVHGERDKKP